MQCSDRNKDANDGYMRDFIQNIIDGAGEGACGRYGRAGYLSRDEASGSPAHARL